MTLAPKQKPKLKPPRPLNRAAYLAYFEAWLEANAVRGEMNATVFGAVAVGEPAFMTFLRKGVRKVEFETLERAVAFCKSYDKRSRAPRRRAAASDVAPAEVNTPSVGRASE